MKFSSSQRKALPSFLQIRPRLESELRAELLDRRRDTEGRRVGRRLDHLQAARHEAGRQDCLAPVDRERSHLHRRARHPQLCPDQPRQHLPEGHPLRHDRLHQEHHQDPVQSRAERPDQVGTSSLINLVEIVIIRR